MSNLPTDAKKRKAIPVATGFVDYFPDAMAAVAELSRVGNDQHNPGKPLHWDRSKSGDESDALMRHFLQRGTIDSDGIRHSAKVAWRAMALLQKEIEADYEDPAFADGPEFEGYEERACCAEPYVPYTPEGYRVGEDHDGQCHPNRGSAGDGRVCNPPSIPGQINWPTESVWKK